MATPESLSGVQVVAGLLVMVLGPGGAAAVGIRVGMNGLKKKIEDTHTRAGEIDAKLDGVVARVNESCVSIGRLEERVDAHADRLDKVERVVERREHARP